MRCLKSRPTRHKTRSPKTIHFRLSFRPPCFKAGGSRSNTTRCSCRSPPKGNYSASPIHANGLVYFLSEKGEGVIVEASKQFKVVSRNKLDERTLASYAVEGNALLIRTESQLLRIESR